ncbi:MAG: hypothetical protein F4179_12865 [Gammaproteobacteria bacterium]|nr:hypothetical protein [Gammaproteobacteria bacterium]MYI23673.1 hypothetical protein [Gammaproteobacteria bacterium]
MEDLRRGELVRDVRRTPLPHHPGEPDRRPVRGTRDRPARASRRGGPVNARDFSPEVREALQRLILSLADTKRMLGIRYSDWLLGAPSIESGIATASMSQDEWGHARLLYAMLKDFGVDPVEVEHSRPPAEYCSASCLDEPFADWAAVVAGVVVVDGTLSLALEGFATGAYDAARRRIPKMLAEEAFHRDFGQAWMRRISEGSEEGRELLADAVESMLSDAVTCLLPGDDEAELLAGAEVKGQPGDARARLARRLAEPLAALGMVPATDPPLPGDWIASRRRPAGEPAGDAVERARGDRNRALFVE